MENVSHLSALEQFTLNSQRDQNIIFQFVNQRELVRKNPSVSIHQYVKTTPSTTPLQKFLERRNVNLLLIDNFIDGKTSFKNTVDTVTQIVSDTKVSHSSRSKIIRNRTIGEYAPNSLKISLTEWLRNYRRNILTSVAWTLMLSIGVYCSWAFIFGMKWVVFLEMLKYIGVNVVPNILIKSLQNIGVSIGTQVSIEALISRAKTDPRVKKILTKKVPKGYLKNILERLGVKTEALRYEDVTQMILGNSMSVAYYVGTGNISGFFVGAGLNIGIKAGKKAVAATREAVETNLQKAGEILSQKSDEVQRVVAHSILNGPRSESVEKDVINAVKLSTRNYRHPKKPAQTTNIPQNIQSAISQNKVLAFASTSAVVLTSLALSSDVDSLTEILKTQIEDFGSTALSKLSELSLETFNILKESELARVTVTKILLERVGVDNLLNVFSDKLTRQQTLSVKTLAAAIKAEKNVGFATRLSEKFMMTLLGGEYISPTELRKKSRRALQNIYLELFPKDIKWRQHTDTQLQDAIISEQNLRLSRFRATLSSVVSSSLSTAMATVVSEMVVEGFAFADAQLSQIESELSSTEEMKKIRRTEVKAEAEKIRMEKETRKIQLQKEKEILHKEALTRLEKRIEVRRLREAAMLEKLSREMDVTVVTQEGVAHPLPPEDIILPEELQRVMEWEFTPLGQYLAKETAKTALEWIPGIGWVQGAIEKFNVAMTTAETVKDIGKITEVLVRLEMGESGVELDPTLGNLDDLLKLRLPSLSTLVEDVIKTDKLLAKEVVLRALKDKIIEGWDTKRTAYEIGKVFLGGTGEQVGIDITESYGAKLWKQAFG